MANPTVLEARPQGNQFEIVATVTQGGVPIDLSGASQIWCTGKHATSEADTVAIWRKTYVGGSGIALSVGDPSGHPTAYNVITATIDPADTHDISPQGDLTVYWDVQILLAGGSVTTVGFGTIKLLAHATRAIS